jgi:threonine synthase
MSKAGRPANRGRENRYCSRRHEVAEPSQRPAILEILRRTGGAAVAVANDEALAAESELCRSEGLFLGPEAATGLVGIRKAVTD